MKPSLGLLTLLVVGCVREPDPLHYEDGCTAPEDCEAVLDRGFCGSCGDAGWVVLSAEGAADFEDDQDQYEEDKECRVTLAMVCIFGDPPGVACVEGQCVLAD